MPIIDDQIRVELAALYRAPERHCHGLSHLAHLLDLFDERRGALRDPDAVEAAIWFRRALHDTRRQDNEMRSAEFAAARLGGLVAPDRVNFIVRAIRAAGGFPPPDFAEGARTRDAAEFLDMDNAILGAPRSSFDEHERALRKEYGWRDDAAWADARAARLHWLLSKPRIYHTPHFRERFEDRARDNLVRALGTLGK